MIKIRFNKTQMVLNDIKTDDRFIKKWKGQLARNKDKEKIASLKYEIETVKEHLGRRMTALKELQ